MEANVQTRENIPSKTKHGGVKYMQKEQNMHTTMKGLKREWNGEAHISYIINVKNFSKNGLAKKFGWSLDTC